MQESMERFFGPGVQAVRQTMLTQEETFREQVCELHRLYNVQSLLMAEMPTRTYEVLNLLASSARPDVLQPSSSSTFNSRGQSSLWGSIKKSNQNSRLFDKTQMLLSHSPKIAIVEPDVACNFHQEGSDSTNAAGSSQFRQKLDLERIPEEDLGDDIDGKESGQKFGKRTKMINNSCYISYVERLQCTEPSYISLSLSSGWESSTVKQELKRSTNSVSSLVPKGHFNDAFKSLKPTRTFEEMLTFPLYHTAETSIQSLSKDPQEASKDRKCGFNSENSPHLAKPQLPNDHTRNEEPLCQKWKVFDSDAVEKLAKRIHTQAHCFSQGSIYDTKELEHSLKLSSYAASFYEQHQSNSDIRKFRKLRGEEVMALQYFEEKNGNPVEKDIYLSPQAKLATHDFSAATDSSNISLGLSVFSGANAPSVYKDRGSTSAFQDESLLSSRGHTTLWMDTEGFEPDKYRSGHTALKGLKSKDFEERRGLSGHDVSVLDTKLSIGKGTIQEPASGFWPGWRNSSKYQTGQLQVQRATAAAEGNNFTKNHASWLAAKHPAHTHMYDQVHTLLAPSLISCTEPSVDLTPRVPEDFLGAFGAKESLPSFTPFSASPPLKTCVKAHCKSLSHHRSCRELSFVSTETSPDDQFGGWVPVSSDIPEDATKTVEIQITKTQKLESRKNCSGQTPKVDTKEDQHIEATVEATSNKKVLNNDHEDDSCLIRSNIQLKDKDSSQVSHNQRTAKDCRAAVSTGNDLGSFFILNSGVANKQNKDNELDCSEACHHLERQSSARNFVAFLNDEKNEFLFPSSFSSKSFPDKRELPDGFTTLSRSICQASSSIEPALQLKLFHVVDFLKGQDISHEISSLLEPKMSKGSEEPAQFIVSESLKDASMESNETNSNDELEHEAMLTLKSIAAGLINLNKNHDNAGEWVNKEAEQAVKPLASETAILTESGLTTGKDDHQHFSSNELIAKSVLKHNELNFISRDQGGRPCLKSSLYSEVSLVADFRPQSFEGFAEGNSDKTNNIAACTLLSLANETLSLPKDVKNVRELTPPVLKQSVAWFANAIAEDADLSKCEATTKSDQETFTLALPPVCGIEPSSSKSQISGLRNGNSHKDYLRFLSRKLKADMNKCTLEKEIDYYEAMTLAMKPSIVTLESVIHYLPETFENKNDPLAEKNNKIRASKRCKRKKYFQNDSFPRISSLSWQEIKEDIHVLSKLAKSIRANVRQNSTLMKTNLSSFHEEKAHAPAAQRRVRKFCTMTNAHYEKECIENSNVVLQPNESNSKNNVSSCCKGDAAEPPYPIGRWGDLTRRRRMQRSRRPTFVPSQYAVL